MAGTYCRGGVLLSAIRRSEEQHGGLETVRFGWESAAHCFRNIFYIPHVQMS